MACCTGCADARHLGEERGWTGLSSSLLGCCPCVLILTHAHMCGWFVLLPLKLCVHSTCVWAGCAGAKAKNGIPGALAGARHHC